MAENLLTNGDAEEGPGGTDTPVRAVTGWTVTDGAPALIAYSFGEGHPGPQDPGPPRRGSRFFAGGTTARTAMRQDVELPESGTTGRTAVDAGTVRFRTAAWLGGFGEQQDGARVSVEFRDAKGTPLALTVLGPVTAEERGYATGTVQRTAEAAVPPGARTARVALVFTREGSAANDGYADGLLLTLHRTAGPGATPAATGTASGRRP